MFKRKIKIRLHGTGTLSVRYGNMWDLAVKMPYKLPPSLIELAPSRGDAESPVMFIGLGVSMTLPKWYGARILPRSSLFGKYGLMLTNSVGIIEHDYSKEWMVKLIRMVPNGDGMYIPAGTRIVQFEVYLLQQAPWYMKLINLFISGFRFKEVDVLTTTRGGFGSTD